MTTAVALGESALEPSSLLLPAAWSPARRFAFRVVFAYVALYSFALATNSDFNLGGWMTLNNLWHPLVTWLGKHVLHLHEDITVFSNGSGDTRYDWILACVWLLTALVAATVWSLVDRRRVEHERLHRILRVWIRYAVAYFMLLYGFDKVFKLQFATPGPGRLLTTFGETSPMSLLWTFMGASTPYTIFAGVAEVLGGVLLLWRRTTTLGALVVAATMTNVVMLNFCYDVCVKLFAAHLLLMAVWLLFPDARSLFDLLVLHRPTQLPLMLWRPATRLGTWARRLGKYGFISYVVATTVWTLFGEMRKRGDNAPKPLGFGVYEVAEFTRGGKVVTLQQNDPQRWSMVVIDRYDGFIRSADGRRELIDPPKDGRIAWTTAPARPPLNFAMLDDKRVVMSDTNLKVTLRKLDHKSYLLTTRGFHLVNESAFMR